LLAPSLQLALDLVDFRYIICIECELAGEDYQQDVNEGVGRDVYQFSEHDVSPWSELTINIPCGRCKWIQPQSDNSPTHLRPKTSVCVGDCDPVHTYTTTLCLPFIGH